MNGTTRLSQRLASWGAILAGLVVLYWGGAAELLPGPIFAPATITWSKQLLATLGQYVWLPAVGVLLVGVCLSPAIAQQVRRNRLAQLAIGLVGLGLIGSGGVALEISASGLGEVVYLLPLFVAGILLVGLVLPG